MRRYFKLVQKLDNGKITVKEFIKRVTSTDKINEYQATAAFMIYQEDGGRRFKPSDFDRVVEVREDPNSTVEKLLKLVKEGVKE